eukprot:13868-Heterococcus_DN1.PRE.4
MSSDFQVPSVCLTDWTVLPTCMLRVIAFSINFQSWWALTVPPLKALRTIGIGRPQLPKADLSGKVVSAQILYHAVWPKLLYYKAI